MTIKFTSAPSTIKITEGGTQGQATVLTSFQRAQMAGYAGTESQFYTSLANPITGDGGIEVNASNAVLLDIDSLPNAP